MSVFVTNNWLSTTSYNTNDFVRYPVNSNTFYYSLTNANLNSIPSAASTSWGGIGSLNGITKPNFIWKPSYPLVFRHEPATNVIQFGKGYAQRIPEVVNNDLLHIEVTFDLRGLKETEAIIHFLRARNGAESFTFTPSVPYNLAKLFVCKNWTCDFVFKENYTIKATFDESVN